MSKKSKKNENIEKIEELKEVNTVENIEQKEESTEATVAETVDQKEDVIELKDNSDKEDVIQEEISEEVSNETVEEVEKNDIIKAVRAKKSKSSIFLYILSLLFLGYMCFNIYDTSKYITELISYGSIDPDTQMNEIISYYVGTCSPYAFYAITTWALGIISSKLTKLLQK